MDLHYYGGPTIQPAGGVLTLYTEGGGGYDEGNGGAGATIQLDNTGMLNLTGTTEPATFGGLMWGSSRGGWVSPDLGSNNSDGRAGGPATLATVNTSGSLPPDAQLPAPSTDLFSIDAEALGAAR